MIKKLVYAVVPVIAAISLAGCYNKNNDEYAMKDGGTCTMQSHHNMDGKTCTMKKCDCPCKKHMRKHM